MIALVAACSPAGADDRALPARWKPLPEIANAVAAAAKADAVTVDRAVAAGDPASGCYAVWLDLHGGSASAGTLADQILASLAGVTVRDVVKPSGADGVLSLAFDKPPYHGTLRAKLGAGAVSAIACFANAREPARCAAACTTVLGAVR